MTRTLILLLCVVSIATRPASADTASRIADFADRAGDKLDQWGLDNKVAEALAKAVIGRARRAIAIGPHIGGAALFDGKDSASGGGLTFGLGLYTFKVPTGLALKEVIKERVKAELKAMIAGGVAIDGDRIVHDIIAKVIRDVLDGAYGSQKFPTPRLTVLVEGQTSFGDAEGIGVRAMVGIGVVSKVSFGVSLAGSFPDSAPNQFLVGPELGIRLTPTGKHRTPVFDVFARTEIGTRSPNPVAVSIGARLLLDIL